MKMGGLVSGISKIKPLLSLLLLSIFLYSSTPRSLLHEAFAHHHDTVDHPTDGQAQVSPRHVHCAFLHMHLTPYTPPSASFAIISSWVVFSYQLPGYHSIHSLPVAFKRLRAPPSIA